MIRERSAPLRRLVPLLAVTAGSVACTEVGSDPNAIVAIQFEGSAYPSIVAGDSLRDSLGTLQPLRFTALNYRNDPVAGVTAEFSSPDTGVRVFSDGVVYSRGPRTDGAPVRLFATVGSLQSQPDTIFVVSRADSIAAGKDVYAPPVGATVVPDTVLPFTVYSSGTPGGAAATAVPYWLVSYQLRFHGQVISPSDTSSVYTFRPVGSGANERRIPSFIDTTSSAGSVARGLSVRCQALNVGQDSVIVIATIRPRRAGSQAKSAQTVVRLQRGTCQ